MTVALSPTTDLCNFYTYAYLDSKGKPYYIGKGRGNRAMSKHRGVIVPDQEKIFFLKTGLTEAEALKHEEYMIAIMGRKIKGEGNLENRLPKGVKGFVYYEKHDPDEWVDPVLCSIFGNKTAACSLLFLHRNDESHALRISKTFGFGLNQTQRQLRRLEDGGILVSRKIGVLRLYSFNLRLNSVRNLRNFLNSIETLA